MNAAGEAIDALVMAVDSPLLDGLDASKRLDLADSDPWGGLTPDEAADLRMVASDLEPLRLIRDGLSSGEMAALTMAADLESVRLLLPRVDARLRHLVLDAMAAIAEESAGVAS